MIPPDGPVPGAPLFGAAAARPPRRWRRGRILGFLLAMQAFLAYPLSDLTHRGLPTAATAAIVLALVVHAGLWMRTMWLALATTTGFPRIAPWWAAEAVVATGLAVGLRGQFEGLFIYASIASALALPLRWVLAAITAATLGALLTDLPRPTHLGAAADADLNTTLSQLCFVFFLGLMMATYRRYMLLITELRTARETVARLAVTEERLRFARDLHDLLGHSLSTISLKAQLARRLAARDPVVAAEIADIETITHHALREVREAVTGYRHTSLATELDTTRGALRAAGVHTDLHLSAAGLPAPVDALLGWVLREATTNILRHSHARTVRIQLGRHQHTVTLTVTDDGTGPTGAAPYRGNGLTGLAERLTAAGGLLDTTPSPAAVASRSPPPFPWPPPLRCPPRTRALHRQHQASRGDPHPAR